MNCKGEFELNDLSISIEVLFILEGSELNGKNVFFR